MNAVIEWLEAAFSDPSMIVAKLIGLVPMTGSCLAVLGFG